MRKIMTNSIYNSLMDKQQSSLILINKLISKDDCGQGLIHNLVNTLKYKDVTKLEMANIIMIISLKLFIY